MKKCLCGHDIKYHDIYLNKRGVYCTKDNCNLWQYCDLKIEDVKRFLKGGKNEN